MKARTLAIAAAIFAATVATPALAGCDYPKTPGSAPNGTTATLDEMLAGKQAFEQYQTDVNTYLDCLDKETKTHIAAVAEKTDKAAKTKQIQEISDKKHDAAIDELKARAEEFNAQLREYKTKHKG